jgi:hypothetical protein
MCIMTQPANAFIMKVAEMRNAQRDYFKNKTPERLERAKKLERDVDSLLASITTPQKSMI